MSALRSHAQHAHDAVRLWHWLAYLRPLNHGHLVAEAEAELARIEEEAALAARARKLFGETRP